MRGMLILLLLLLFLGLKNIHSGDKAQVQVLRLLKPCPSLQVPMMLLRGSAGAILDKQLVCSLAAHFSEIQHGVV
ncbi:MAG TPA: hypothetical protein DET40_23460 [Lentisphaeria bacterium]|nr:hypothetical protein [Lentisphaeria bacterium]